MILIIGGAYQGKLDYAINNFPGRSVFQCSEEKPEMDTKKDIINSLHLMGLAQIREGINTIDFLRGLLPQLKDKIIICDDIFSGIVPVEYEMRLWRETMGGALTLLSKNANKVIRVFCGIGSMIK